LSLAGVDAMMIFWKPGGSAVAKGQKRSGREPKKPKASKKTTVAAASFITPPSRPLPEKTKK
jgi:hypothetical protein